MSDIQILCLEKTLMIQSDKEKVDNVWICGVSKNFPPEFFEDNKSDSDFSMGISSSKSFQSDCEEESKEKEEVDSLTQNYVLDCIWLCSSGWVENKCDKSDDREFKNENKH